MAGVRHHSTSEVLGVLASWSHLTRLLFLSSLRGPAFLRGGVRLEHGRENGGELMGGGRRRLRRPQCAAHATKQGSQRAGALAETVRGQTQGAAGAIGDPPAARGAHCAATALVRGPEAQPGGTMRVCRPCLPLEAHRCADDVARPRLASGHVRAIHAGEPVQRGTESKGGCVPVRVPLGGRRWGAGGVGTSDHGRTGAEDARHCLIAGGEVRRGTSRALEGVWEGADLCRPVIPLQRCGHGVRTGCATRVPRRRAGLRVTLPSDQSAEQTPPRHACPITKNVVPVAMHVLQRLVPGLPRRDRPLEEMVSLAEETAALAEGLRRPPRRRPYPITLARVPPPTIEASRVRASRHVLHVAGMDHGARTPAGVQHLQAWNPGHARGFHRHRGDTTGSAPVSQTRHVTGKGAQWLDRRGIAIGGDPPPMLFSPHSDAGGMRMEDGPMLGRGFVLLAFVGPTFLQSEEERGEQGETGLLQSKDTMGEGAPQRRDPVAS
jgi:hypothetical protein